MSSRFIASSLLLAVLGGLVLVFGACGSSEAVQADKVPHIGFLSVSATPGFIDALKKGMREHGYIEGESIQIDWKITRNRDELPGIASEFVEKKVDLIIAGGTKAVKAAMADTSPIPIVMTNSGDAVGTGLVESLARPGGNVTGSTQISPQLSAKRVQLITEAIPGISRLAILWHPDHPNTPRMFQKVEEAVVAFGIELISVEVREPNPDFEAAFNQAVQEGSGALLVLRDPLTVKHQQQIVDLAAKHRLPAMYETINFVEAGGLMLYGPSFDDLYRNSATFMDKILKGANPAEMPVEHPTTFDLVVNQKAAEMIGLTFPEEFLLRTTHVIR